MPSDGVLIAGSHFHVGGMFVNDKTVLRLRFTAGVVFGLALLFFAFFNVSKHSFGDVNPFGDDPYDAVGSFGIQLTMLAALLGLLRALRPASAGEISTSRVQLVLRACGLALLSLVVTLAADGIALARYPALWIGSPAGQQLVYLTGGLALLAVLAGALVFYTAGGLARPVGWNGRRWIVALAICALGALALALYPAEWRQGVAGVIATAAMGMLMFFIGCWVLARAIFPVLDGAYEDVLDDLAAVVGWLKEHIRPARGLFNCLEGLAGRRWVRAATGWLNPRRHAWNFVLPAALLMGVALMLTEALGEGLAPQLNTVVLVAGVYIGLECAGVLLGYGLLGRFLGLFRRDG
jgi:hypothetical protein